MIKMFLIKAILQLNNLFKAIDNTHTTTTQSKSIANETSQSIREITKKYDQRKRYIIYPMLRGTKGRF